MNASYGYDPLGRRQFKFVNGTATAWSSWGDQELTEWQGSGTIYLQRRFVYGPGLDEPLASIDASNARTYQFTDALGSVIGLANGSGQLTEKYAYTAYGTGVVTGPGTAAYRFAGRLLDGETGLYHNRARAYSPVLGRFLQADPIGTEGGINLYAYTYNDPINHSEPFGHDSYIVARPLNSFLVSLNFGHAFIVTNAQYLGDPNAQVISFGKLANENMGNVNNPSRAYQLSETAHKTDVYSWNSLATSNSTASVYTISAPDSIVSQVAGSVSEKSSYSPVPGFTFNSVNSNSAAAAAVADRATQISGGDSVYGPYGYALPGYDESPRVKFK